MYNMPSTQEVCHDLPFSSFLLWILGDQLESQVTRQTQDSLRRCSKHPREKPQLLLVEYPYSA